MSNLKQGIEIGVTAKTDGATQALDKTADATERMKTAAEAAAANQADLAKAIDTAKRAIDSQKSANDRARQAEEILAATIRKHGAASDQAKAATEAHAKAVAAATAAEKEAKEATQQMTLALAKANAEADKASPALAKMAKQVDAVAASAQRAGHESAKLNLSTVGEGADKASGGFNLMSMAGGKLSAMLGPAALGGALIAFAGWVSEAAQATLQYETALANIPFAIDRAQAATGGLVGKMDLAKSAAQAVSLGIVKTEKDFNTLAEAATKIALRLGTDATQAIGDMTTALGRGSPLILDNLGVIVKVSKAQEDYAAKIGKTVSALTEEEKTLAFREAAMVALLKSANETKVAFDGNAASILRAKTALGDFWDAIKRGTVNVVGGSVSTVYEFTDEINRMAETAEAVAAAGGPMELLADRMIAFARETDGATSATLEWMAAQSMTADELARVQGAQDSERRSALAKRAAGERAAYVAAQEAESAQLRSTYAKRDAFWKERAAKDAAEAEKEAERKRGKKKADKGFMDPGDVSIMRGFDGRDQTDNLALDMVHRQQATAAAAVDAEIAKRQEAIDAINLEMEARQAAGQGIDDLYSRQMEMERALLDFTAQASKDRAQIAAGETRFAKAQHQARLRDLAGTYAKEQKERELREARVAKMAGTVESFSATMIDAMQAEAEGSKYAVAVSLEAWLKGIRNQMIVTALKETALGVASAASYNYPAAAQHFTAAGLAGAAAVAAGTGAVVVRGVAEGVSGKSWSDIKGGGSKGGADSAERERKDEDRARSREDSKREGNEFQEIPVSWEHYRRDNAESSAMIRKGDSAANGAPVIINFHGITAGDKRDLGAAVEKSVRIARTHGARV